MYLPISQTTYVDATKYLKSSEFMKQFKNLRCGSLLHALPTNAPAKAIFEGNQCLGEQISLLDQMGTQYTKETLVAALANLQHLSSAEVYVAKNPEKTTLTTENVLLLLKAAVSSANRSLQPEELPENLRSYFKEKETKEEEMDWETTETTEHAAHMPLNLSTLPQDQLEREYNKSDYKHVNASTSPINAQNHLTKFSTSNHGSSTPNQKSPISKAEVPTTRVDTAEAFPEMLSGFVNELDKMATVSSNEVARCFHQVTKSYSLLHKAYAKDVFQQADSILKATKKYIDEMESSFKTCGYFSKEALEQNHTNVTSDLLESISECPQIVKSYIRIIQTKIFGSLCRENDSIRKHLLNIVQTSKTTVTLYYSKELERIRTDHGPFASKKFQKITAILFSKCMDAFKIATEYKGKSLKDTPELKHELDTLASALKKEAERQSLLNSELLERKNSAKQEKNLVCPEHAALVEVPSKPRQSLENRRQSDVSQSKDITPRRLSENLSQSEASPSKENKSDDEGEKYRNEERILLKCVDDIKSQYRERFNALTASRSFKIDKMRHAHTGLAQEMKKLFEMELRNKLDKSERKIANIWKQEMHPSLEKWYQIKRDSLLDKEASKKRALAKQKQQQATSSYKHNQQNNGDEEVSFAKVPLIFHLCQNTISMAIYWEGKPILIKNEWNKETTSTKIGQTTDGRLLYGEAFVNEPAGNFRMTCNVLEILREYKTSHFEVKTESGSRQVTAEFLLGFVLKKLKLEAEKMLLGQDMTSCTICIPFFYTSMQRKRIMDSARIAGFKPEQVHFLNDISAAAYQYAAYERKFPPLGKFLVFTESVEGVLDAGIFRYEKYANKNGKTYARAISYCNLNKYCQMHNAYIFRLKQ